MEAPTVRFPQSANNRKNKLHQLVDAEGNRVFTCSSSRQMVIPFIALFFFYLLLASLLSPLPTLYSMGVYVCICMCVCMYVPYYLPQSHLSYSTLIVTIVTIIIINYLSPLGRLQLLLVRPDKWVCTTSVPTIVRAVQGIFDVHTHPVSCGVSVLDRLTRDLVSWSLSVHRSDPIHDVIAHFIWCWYTRMTVSL